MKLPYTIDLNSAIDTLCKLKDAMCSALNNECEKCEFWCDCDKYCTLNSNVEVVKAIKNEFDIVSDCFECEYCGKYVALYHSEIAHCPYCGRYIKHFKKLKQLEDRNNADNI